MVITEVIGTSCAQALGGVIPPFELNLWRFLAELTLLLPVVSVKCINVIIERKYIVWIAVRCICLCISNLLLFTAAIHLPVGTLAGVQDSSLLILSAVITSVISRKCKIHVMCAVVICITGIILVSQPEFIFKDAPNYRYLPVCTNLKPSEQLLTTNNSSGRNSSAVGQETDPVRWILSHCGCVMQRSS